MLRLSSLAAMLLPLATAAPGISTCPPPPYGLNLPASYPPLVPPCNVTVPTHFSLRGYSFDGSIVNQSYYVPHTPNRNTYGFMRSEKDGAYGSYAFGIGPRGHVFGMNDGDVGFVDLFDFNETDVQLLAFDVWVPTDLDPANPYLPVCDVMSYYNILECTIGGETLQFGYCGSGATNGNNKYYPDSVVWGTSIPSECTKIVLRAEQVPKTYGHSISSVYCRDHPDTPDCPSAASPSGPGN